MIQTVPAAVLMWMQIPGIYRKLPFGTCCRKSFFSLMFLLPGFVMLTMASYFLGLDIFQYLADMYMVLAICCFILYSHTFLDMDWKRYLLTSLLWIQYEAIVVIVTGALVNEYSPEILTVDLPYHPVNIRYLMIVNLVLFPPICLIARNVIGKNLVHIRGRVLLHGYFYVALSVSIFIFSSFFLRSQVLGQNLLFLGTVLICNIITYIVFFSEVSISRRQAQMEEQMHMIESRYRMIRKNVEMTRQMRHDMRHQINALKVLYEHQDWDGLGKFLWESQEQQKNVEDKENMAGHLFLNILLDYYRESAEKKGISMDTEILVNCEYPFSMVDLTSLVGNCLENALEACERIPKEKAFIRVRIRERAGFLLFWEENSCRCHDWEGNSVFQGWTGFLSHKRSGGYGIGLKSMDTVAKKYGGSLLCKQERGVFTVKAELKIPGE